MGTLMHGATALPIMLQALIPPRAPTGTAERRRTRPDRAPRTRIRTATAHTMPKGQERRLAVTRMVAVRRTPPVREHRQRALTVAAHTMRKGRGRRPPQAPTAAAQRIMKV